MIRKLIFTTAALVALSAGAQAGNTVTTTQVGVINSSSTTQNSVFGNNSATLAQFAVLANSASISQATIFGTNSSSVLQDSFF
jgi:major curlin subunit